MTSTVEPTTATGRTEGLDILAEIVAAKRQQVATAKARLSQQALVRQLRDAPPVRDFVASLLKGPQIGLIAEVKQASPSAGVIRANFDPVEVAEVYERYGANCLSVLTDEPFFRGHLDDLRAVRRRVGLPLLRKDFVIDPYQVIEARVAGADCVLLIAECLSPDELKSLCAQIRDLGMAALIELYDRDNLPAVLAAQPSLVGVNNRDLKRFVTDIDHTLKLQPLIPAGVPLVSESGIRTRADVQRLIDQRVAAMLVGESLMRAPDIGLAVDELLPAPRRPMS